MQNWKKLGQIFLPDNDNFFLQSHAANPLPIHLNDDVFRVFYSGRNKENKSSVGFVDIDIINQKVIKYPKEPLITFGKEDSFYSHGISIGNMYEAQNNQYILFMAWQIHNNQHWRGDIGRLQLIDNEKILINPENIFMGIDEEDEVSLSYPFVICNESIYKMWYGSTVSWESANGEMIHVIKYATSNDAIHWKKYGIAIPYEIGVAQAFSKPSVIIDETGYHMWYSYRSGQGQTYRIGYAYSSNGLNWERKHNEIHLDVSKSGWDSEMVCYPFVFDHKGKRYMLYNGNGYGKTGFGLAVLEQD